MNCSQFLLLKLAEECSEVAQRAIKQIQFGKLEIQHDQFFTNCERLKQELLDLYAIAAMLEEIQELPEITFGEEAEAFERKRKKLQKYLDYSAQLGQIQEIKL